MAVDPLPRAARHGAPPVDLRLVSGHPAGTPSRRALRRLLLGLLHAGTRPEIEGLKYVPATGPVIVAANHLSFIDSVVLPVVVPRPLYFLGKAEYVASPGPRGRAMAAFFRATGMVPVERGNGTAAVAAIEAGQRILRAGKAFGIYPEGTRSPDGRLYRGRTGVARLAISTGALIVPCGLVGTDRVQPTGTRLPRPHRIVVRFGEPMDVSGHAGRERDVRLLRDVTDTVMGRIAELSGQEYVDSYYRR